MAGIAATTVRHATPEDAEAIATIHVGSWRSAYRGMVPDALLEWLSVERRRTGWRERIEGSLEPDSNVRVWIAEREGRVVGFADTAPSRDENGTDRTAELLTIYVDPSATGTGVGRALLRHATDDLRARDFAHAVLWVLAANEPTRRFYERAGWRHDGTVKREAFGEWPLEVARYRISLTTP